jgi:hypothetical protein
VNVMSCVIWGPLQNATPSVGGGVLSIGIGVCGLIYILVNLLGGKGKNVSRWKIAFCFAVLLFFVAAGIMQVLAAR